MRLMRCFPVLAALGSIGLFSSEAMAQSGGIRLDHVTGVSVYDSTKIPVGRPIELFLRLDNQTSTTFIGATNGFELSSLDGAKWYPSLFVDTGFVAIPPPGHSIYDTSLMFRWAEYPSEAAIPWFDVTADSTIWDLNSTYFVVHSNGSAIGEFADTIGIRALASGSNSLGLFPGLDMMLGSIVLDSLDRSSVGSTFCIDSAYFGLSGVGIWLWDNGTSLVPDWDGPHCFDIVDCCLGMRGNVNFDVADEIDISDLNAMIAYMFKGGSTPSCLNEANVDGLGGQAIDIADLNYLIAFMFRSGPPPVACQ